MTEEARSETAAPGSDGSAELSLPADPIEAREVLVERLAASRNDARTYLEDLEKVTADFEEFRSGAVPRDEAQQYLDDLKRVAADFDNYRKRTQREMAENIERASQRVVSGLLPVLDSFDLAVAHQPETESEAKLLGGIAGTRQQLLEALIKEGLAPIPAVGEPFDPEVHEAVSMQGSPEHPVVVTEMRRGYTLHGRVLRPALVTVGEDPIAAVDDDPGAPDG
ncbi:MAG: nucleotide exchange factor GrpE [Acidimicrobiia bacterium]|nr:nucleotide exchange factor GrpE [Acidimicrobiia bacterium]NNL68464.1 nucleotide exchange factor GrpE [Acidimicrobiia bacterium]